MTLAVGIQVRTPQWAVKSGVISLSMPITLLSKRGRVQNFIFHKEAPPWQDVSSVADPTVTY